MHADQALGMPGGAWDAASAGDTADAACLGGTPAGRMAVRVGSWARKNITLSENLKALIGDFPAGFKFSAALTWSSGL